MHRNEATARAAKAGRYIAFLDHHLGDQVTADAVARLTPTEWEGIAAHMGEQPPSDATVSVIVGIYADRAAHPDPFELIGTVAA